MPDLAGTPTQGSSALPSATCSSPELQEPEVDAAVAIGGLIRLTADPTTAPIALQPNGEALVTHKHVDPQESTPTEAKAVVAVTISPRYTTINDILPSEVDDDPTPLRGVELYAQYEQFTSAPRERMPLDTPIASPLSTVFATPREEPTSTPKASELTKFPVAPPISPIPSLPQSLVEVSEYALAGPAIVKADDPNVIEQVVEETTKPPSDPPASLVPSRPHIPVETSEYVLPAAVTATEKNVIREGAAETSKPPLDHPAPHISPLSRIQGEPSEHTLLESATFKGAEANVIKEGADETTKAFLDAPASPIPSHSQSPVETSEHEVIGPPLVEATEPSMVKKGANNKRSAPKPTAKKGSSKKEPPVKKRKLNGSSAAAKPKASRAGAVGRVAGSATTRTLSPIARSVQNASTEPEDIDESIEDIHDGSDFSENEPAQDDDTPYCYCRKPDNGIAMLGCENDGNGTCVGYQWYHRPCIKISERRSRLYDEWRCPECIKAGHGVSTWRRLCRRPGCQEPARTEVSPGQEFSKYCSEECGLELMRSLVDRARQVSSKKSHGPNEGNDPRGGALSSTELKTLVTSVENAKTFNTLGNGVLSPPATPSRSNSRRQSMDDLLKDNKYNARFASVKLGKDRCRARHWLLKDRLALVNAAKQVAALMAEAKGVKPKDLCGYDVRINWDDAAFDQWRSDPEGQTMLHRETPVIPDPPPEDNSVLCTKKRCSKHNDWVKIALDSVRSDIAENSENMRSLDREEKEMRENAAIRARAARYEGGTVEHHDVLQASLGPANILGGDVHGMIKGGNEQDVGEVKGSLAVSPPAEHPHSEDVVMVDA